MTSGGLHELFVQSAARWPDQVAVADPTRGQRITYGELDQLSSRLRDHLHQMGVQPGDRVGIQVSKSIDSVASIFGILKAGAAYVPVDPTAPAARNAYVFDNCTVRVVIVEQSSVESLGVAFQRVETKPQTLVLGPDVVNTFALTSCLDRRDEAQLAPSVETSTVSPNDVAYILYTSGSTGKPKGVTLTHENGLSFVDWCSTTFEPRDDDRFSSHAPFHFDLSILDLYVSLKHGATLYLIGEQLGKSPSGMVELVARERLTIWYSTPSVLSALVHHGKLEAHQDLALRLVLFAGEVFPVKHLRRLKEIVHKARFFNLYGPTETNVCTAYEIPQRVPADRTEPYPIGQVCSHLTACVIDEEERVVATGEEGELCIRGPSVMEGYWKLPKRTQSAFCELANKRWYRTGDLVVEEADGLYSYVGRRDRMVKRRGYRIELDEIEAILYRHPEISEAATVAQSDDEGVQINCFYGTRDGTSLSLIHLKQFCSEHLPLYMIPDRFFFRDTLPKTSTDKIDYQRLVEAR